MKDIKNFKYSYEAFFNHLFLYNSEDYSASIIEDARRKYLDGNPHRILHKAHEEIENLLLTSSQVEGKLEKFISETLHEIYKGYRVLFNEYEINSDPAKQRLILLDYNRFKEIYDWYEVNIGEVLDLDEANKLSFDSIFKSKEALNKAIIVLVEYNFIDNETHYWKDESSGYKKLIISVLKTFKVKDYYKISPKNEDYGRYSKEYFNVEIGGTTLRGTHSADLPSDIDIPAWNG